MNNLLLLENDERRGVIAGLSGFESLKDNWLEGLRSKRLVVEKRITKKKKGSLIDKKSSLIDKKMKELLGRVGRMISA